MREVTELRNESRFYEYLPFHAFIADPPLLEKELKQCPKPLLHLHPQLLFTPSQHPDLPL